MPPHPPQLSAVSAPATVPVWPLWLRLGHWALAATVIASFATHEGGGRWHEALGYAALAVAVLRLAIGLATGDRHARLRSFVHGVAHTLGYVRQLMRGQAPRHIGHNPLGGWMMLVLLANTVACGLTGWLFTTDRFFGEEWLEELHGALGQAFVPLVLLHVGAAVWASRKQRENLVAAMLHGRKRPAGPTDVA